MSRNPTAQILELELCRRDIFYWWQWWPWTFDPRNAGTQLPSWLPFDLFPKQVEAVNWFLERIEKREDGLFEKSRGMGFTWVACGITYWHWRFVPGFVTTFGSRKVDLVDRLGDPDSIFEKLRMLIAGLPVWMMPEGFNAADHATHLLIRNPVNGNTIKGEGGDQMGRGGRSTLYILDEAAFVERAERVEAASSANANIRVWASTVNGTENFFARKRFGGTLRPEQIFRFHYSQAPDYIKTWAEDQRSNMEPFMFASEFDIDYSASVEGICIPAAWVEAAKRISKLTTVEPTVEGIAGGDVGGGKARSVLVNRFGPVVLTPDAWTEADTIDTAYKMIDAAHTVELKRSDGYECKVKYLRYDSPGVGFGVQAAMKRANRRGLIVVGVNTGEPPSERKWPDGETSKEKFRNSKAEAWWLMRELFKRTYEMVLFLEGKPGGIKHEVSDCISLPDDTQGPHARALSSQLSLIKWTRMETGKIIMESKASLSRRNIASPDYADALALTFTGYSQAEVWARFGRSVASSLHLVQ